MCVCVRVDTVLVVALTAKFDVGARTKCDGRRHCRGTVTEEELQLERGTRGSGRELLLLPSHIPLTAWQAKNFT